MAPNMGTDLNGLSFPSNSPLPLDFFLKLPFQLNFSKFPQKVEIDMDSSLHHVLMEAEAAFDDGALSTLSPLPNILDTKLIAIGIPIEARVPRNPPSLCLRVGLITNVPTV